MLRMLTVPQAMQQQAQAATLDLTQLRFCACDTKTELHVSRFNVKTVCSRCGVSLLQQHGSTAEVPLLLATRWCLAVAAAVSRSASRVLPAHIAGSDTPSTTASTATAL
jgi:hypothetical protein